MNFTTLRNRSKNRSMKRTEYLLYSFLMLGLSNINIARASEVQIEMLSVKAASANSFVFYDSIGSLIVDTTRSSKEAREVAKLARKHGAGPKIIFITHGHRDHYLGMGALKEEFPKAKILVANQEIKNDIVSSAKDAAEKRGFGEEVLMYPKSETDPNGFDYENEIQILNGNILKLPAGGRLEVISSTHPTEAPHETMLYSKDLNALFASDLVYNGVHLWLAREVDGNAIANWQFELNQLKTQYGSQKTKVYPGHGIPTDTGIFDIDRIYMSDFLAVINESKTQQDAKVAMMKKYPSWESSDFILPLSIKTQFERLKKQSVRGISFRKENEIYENR